MNHPIYHAWDCPCGARNAPELPACFRCGSPVSAGQAVYLAGPRVQEPGPAVERTRWGWSPQVRPMVWVAALAFAACGLRWLAAGSLGPLHWLLLVFGVVILAAAHIIEAVRR